MAYQEEEQARIRRQRSKNAIALAMQGRWREAVAANKEIIESFPNDIDAYNRLGKAYIELGEYALAKEAYTQAVELDSYNIIALKNLRRLSYLGETAVSLQSDSDKAKPEHFIEETGKAGVVNLYRLAPQEVLAKIVAGDRVYLKVNDSSLAVENGRGEYLGQVEPRHAQRLIKLIAGGNKYAAAIVSSAEDRVAIIIRETYQDPSQAGQLSFPPKGGEGLHPYISEKMLRRGLEYVEAAAEEESTEDESDSEEDNEE
jgi:tetratricopeptide (TPR) repeat protein